MPFLVFPKITNRGSQRSQKFCDPRFVICDLRQFVIFVIFTKKLPPIAISVVPPWCDQVRPTPRPRSQTTPSCAYDRTSLSITQLTTTSLEPLSLLPPPIMTMPPTQLPPLPLERSSYRRVPCTTYHTYKLLTQSSTPAMAGSNWGDIGCQTSLGKQSS